MNLKYIFEERSQHETEDLAKAVNYQSRVDMQSVVLCVLVVVCGVVQATVLKRLFDKKVWDESIFSRSHQ